MKLFTDKRAVQLKTSVLIEGNANAAARKEPAHLNFIAMEDRKPAAEEYGVTKEQDRTALNSYLSYMKSIDHRFFTWLEASADNAILFANDPLKAIKTAIPDFDESVFSGLNKDIFG